MKNTGELVKFQIFFFIVSFLLLLTYSLSFYISDLVRIFRNPLKIVYILLYSGIFSLYFSVYVVYNVKTSKAKTFVSALLTLFYLHEFERNIFFYGIDKVNYHYLSWISYIAAFFAVVFALLSVFNQFKAAGFEFKFRIGKRKARGHSKDSEYFI